MRESSMSLIGGRIKVEGTLSSYFVLCGNRSHHSSTFIRKASKKVSEINMEETKEVIFKSMREASEYFGFPYSGKAPERNDKYLSCYCDWERISRNYIKAKQIYEIPKEFKRQSTRKYKYKVGDIISSTNSSFRVLKQIRIYRDKNRNGVKETVNEKGYFVKCVKDGYEFEVLESALSRNYGCPVCSNRKVIK